MSMTETGMAGGAPRPGDRLGLDANRPIEPKTGRIQPQVADPNVIASTSAHWVRLNFVLGPYSGPKDPVRHEGRTWAQAYGQIISGFRRKGLGIYGLIGVEAMPVDPGERFRTAPRSGSVQDPWIDQYVGNFLCIVGMFHRHVAIFESFNEPDDWHGQRQNWVHPAWFAIMLERIYVGVRSRPELTQVKVVSGPLQGLQANNNAAVYYLYQVYRFGKEWFGWGKGGKPFPFDGVGYHLYVRQDYTIDQVVQERSIRATYRRYLDGMHRVVRQQEGRDKPLYVSELGWNSNVDEQEVRRREQYQADCLRAGLETVLTDPYVELGIWFCIQDFSTGSGELRYGLYRAGEPTPAQRKPAFDAFRKLCEGPSDQQDGTATSA